jgi:hypothetical protein
VAIILPFVKKRAQWEKQASFLEGQNSMTKSIPSVSVTYACNGATMRSNELGMRPMQERVSDIGLFLCEKQ